MGGSERAASHLHNYVRYMATRKGAQRMTIGHEQLPAPAKQQEMVAQLLREFPLSRGLFEYDAKIGDAYVFSHLDGDLARLVRFKEAVQNDRAKYEVLCYTYQMTFIREYLGNHVTIKTIGLDAVEAELDPERRDLFER